MAINLKALSINLWLVCITIYVIDLIGVLNNVRLGNQSSQFTCRNLCNRSRCGGSRGLIWWIFPRRPPPHKSCPAIKLLKTINVPVLGFYSQMNACFRFFDSWLSKELMIFPPKSHGIKSNNYLNKFLCANSSRESNIYYKIQNKSQNSKNQKILSISVV